MFILRSVLSFITPTPGKCVFNFNEHCLSDLGCTSRFYHELLRRSSHHPTKRLKFKINKSNNTKRFQLKGRYLTSKSKRHLFLPNRLTCLSLYRHHLRYASAFLDDVVRHWAVRRVKEEWRRQIKQHRVQFFKESRHENLLREAKEIMKERYRIKHMKSEQITATTNSNPMLHSMPPSSRPSPASNPYLSLPLRRKLRRIIPHFTPPNISSSLLSRILTRYLLACRWQRLLEKAVAGQISALTFMVDKAYGRTGKMKYLIEKVRSRQISILSLAMAVS